MPTSTIPEAPAFPKERVIRDILDNDRYNITASDIKIHRMKDFKHRGRKVVAEMYLQERAWKKEIKIPHSVSKRRDMRLDTVNKLQSQHGRALFVASVEVPKPKAVVIMDNYLRVNGSTRGEDRAGSLQRSKDKVEGALKLTRRVPIGFIECSIHDPLVKQLKISKETSNQITRIYSYSEIIGSISKITNEEIMSALLNHVYKATVKIVEGVKDSEYRKKWVLLEQIEDEGRRRRMRQHYSFGAFIFCVCHTKKVADFLTKRFQPRFQHVDRERFLGGKLKELEALMSVRDLSEMRNALEIERPRKYVVLMHIGGAPTFAAEPSHVELLNGN